MSAPSGEAVTPSAFRHVMAHLPTGVTVIAAAAGDERHGMTANTVTSVSLDPVLLLACLVRGSRTSRAVQESGAFSVNVLRHDQEELSRRFSRPGADHFDGIGVELGARGLPRLPGCLAFLTCRVVQMFAAGDHDVVVGEVETCEAGDGEPLVFFQGGYERLAFNVDGGRAVNGRPSRR